MFSNLPDQIIGLFSILLSYLIGSIPSGFIAGKWLADVDLRQVGSGSTGATNVLRTVGKLPALIVFLIDVIKGTIPILIAKHFGLSDFWQICVGIFSLAGHIWPIWLKWKGGKAVATGLGMLLGLSWPVGLSCLGIFLLVLTFSKTVSLSSLIAAISLPLLMLLSFGENNFRIAYFCISILTMVIVVWRHRSNIRRILNGSEPKIS